MKILEKLHQERSWECVKSYTARSWNDDVQMVRLKLSGHGNTQHGLLYVCDDLSMLDRVATSASAKYGEQLFVVPNLLERGIDWVLLEDIDGVPLKEWLLTQGFASFGALEEPKRQHLLELMGMTLRKVHSVFIPDVFGDICEPKDRSEKAQWSAFSGFLAFRLERIHERLNHGDAWTPGGRSLLLQSIGELRQELSSFHSRYPACWVHGSPCFDDFWVDEGGREIVGLTGFERSAHLPHEHDLAYFLWMQDIPLDECDAWAKSFYRGYGTARTMDVQRRERFYRRFATLEALTSDAPMAMEKEQLMSRLR